MSTWFEPDMVPGGEHPYPGGVAVAYPRRVPGTHMHPGLRPKPSYTPLAPGLLEQVIDGIQHLDDPAEAPVLQARRPSPDEKLPQFNATVAARSGAGSQPAQAPLASGWPEGVARGLLIAGLWDAASWYRAMDAEHCADCADRPCDFHARCLSRALEYEDMHDAVANARSDSAALHGVACTVQIGRADLGDIASPGSPLESLLLLSLERLNAEGR